MTRNRHGRPEPKTAPKSPETDGQAAKRYAYAEVGSSELTRDLNRDIVLERIRTLQPISRVDLARDSGLQPSTISSIVEQLLEERWIRESAMVKTARGRRPTLLSLSDDLLFLAVDLRPRHAVVAVVDLNGRFLERQFVPLGRDGSAAVARLGAVMQRLRARHPGQRFEGAGVSVPGRVDPANNRIVIAPNLPWYNIDLAGELHALLGLELQLENAANASLLSELWFGRVDGIRNAMLLTVSEGVGVAILADGRLIQGQCGLAGEFGHLCLDPEGPVCGCGARGCWEVFASSRAVQRLFQELDPAGRTASMPEIAALAMDGDPAAIAALRRQAVAIGQGLHLLNAVLSPEVILLAGDFSAAWDLFQNLVESECRAGAMDGQGPALVPVSDGEWTRLRGAAAVVLQRHSGYYRAAHVRVEHR